MDLKIQVSNGFEDYCLEKSSEHDFISVHTTNNDMRLSNITNNAHETFKRFSSLEYMKDINYPLCQAIACCYRQDFHSLNSLVFSNCKIRATGKKWSMDAYVDALSKVRFMPEATLDNFIFYNNIRSDIMGYVCMDLFMDTVDVNSKLKTIEQNQSEYGVEVLMNETDMNKVAIRFKALFEFIQNVGKKAKENGLDNLDIGNIDAFAIENNENYTDFLLILSTEFNLFMKNLYSCQNSVELNNLVVLNKTKFEQVYKDRITDNTLDLNNVDNRMLKDCDKCMFEIFTMCVDMCYAKKHKPFVILNINREFDRSSIKFEDVDNLMSILLPEFSKFVRSISDGGIIIYTGIPNNSKTEKALIEYEASLGIR